MYRVIAARSLKFSEHRTDETRQAHERSLRSITPKGKKRRSLTKSKSTDLLQLTDIGATSPTSTIERQPSSDDPPVPASSPGGSSALTVTFTDEKESAAVAATPKKNKSKKKQHHSSSGGATGDSDKQKEKDKQQRQQQQVQSRDLGMVVEEGIKIAAGTGGEIKHQTPDVVVTRKKSELRERDDNGRKLHTTHAEQLQTPTIVAAVIQKELEKSHRSAQGVWSPLGEPYHRTGSFAVDLGDERNLKELQANRTKKQTSRNLQHPARTKLNDLVSNLHQTKAAILAINLYNQNPAQIIEHLNRAPNGETRANAAPTVAPPEKTNNRKGGQRKLTTSEKIMNLGRDPATLVQEEEVVEKKQRDHLKESRRSHLLRWRDQFEEKKNEKDRALMEVLVSRSEAREAVYNSPELLNRAVSFVTDPKDINQFATQGRMLSKSSSSKIISIWERVQHKDLKAEAAHRALLLPAHTPPALLPPATANGPTFLTHSASAPSLHHTRKPSRATVPAPTKPLLLTAPTAAGGSPYSSNARHVRTASTHSMSGENSARSPGGGGDDPLDWQLVARRAEGEQKARREAARREREEKEHEARLRARLLGNKRMGRGGGAGHPPALAAAAAVTAAIAAADDEEDEEESSSRVTRHHRHASSNGGGSSNAHHHHSSSNTGGGNRARRHKASTGEDDDEDEAAEQMARDERNRRLLRAQSREHSASATRLPSSSPARSTRELSASVSLPAFAR